jgi:hypothetical protein
LQELEGERGSPCGETKEEHLMNEDRIHLDLEPTGHLDEAVPGAVVPLRRLGGDRAAGDPDVRGWLVAGTDGRTIGEVEDLLMDTGTRRARYLCVLLDPGLQGEPDAVEGPAEAGPIPGLTPGEEEALRPRGAAPASLGALIGEQFVRSTLSAEENELSRESSQEGIARRVLIPIGGARLDPEHDRIVADGLRAADAAGLPDYDGETLTRDGERHLWRRFGGGDTPAAGDDLYSHPLYDEDRFYAAHRESARAAGLAPGRAAAAPPDREVTGELDRAVGAPDHGALRGR